LQFFRTAGKLIVAFRSSDWQQLELCLIENNKETTTHDDDLLELVQAAKLQTKESKTDPN
jgi:hypothetical protein